jgi:pimeloyl-ACP methyl ester carboxylesterase
VALIDHVWGPKAHVHVFGVSMGGMIGQMLGLQLLAQERLASLTLAVTTRGYYPFPLHIPFWLLLFFVVPRVVLKDRRKQVCLCSLEMAGFIES